MAVGMLKKKDQYGHSVIAYLIYQSIMQLRLDAFTIIFLLMVTLFYSKKAFSASSIPIANVLEVVALTSIYKM